MLTKPGLTAVALMVGAAIFSASAPADARGNGYHNYSSGSIVGTRFAGRQEIVPASGYRFGEGYRRFGRYEPRWFGYRHWHRYAWFRHFHHHRWFHRYGFEHNFYEG